MKQTEQEFQLVKQTEEFRVVRTGKSNVDLLWVIDNSSSMEPSQEKLRKAFAGFAQKYMTPEMDIRTAVITTDTYLAHPAFQNYINSPDPRLKNTKNKNTTPKMLNPALGPDYAKLLPGIHDGPTPGLCAETNYYFWHGLSQCRIRDAKDAPRGIESCVNPRVGESSISQCVNTVTNNTVRSGKPILNTKTATNVEELIRDFLVNVSTGAAGIGSERGMGSVIQLISDNELKDNAPTENAFFRKDSLRVIVFLADEDDQTMAIPASPSKNFGPLTQTTSSCREKTVDGYKYTLASCPKDQLIPPSEIKSQLEAFFRKLDGVSLEAAANLMVVSIVPTTGKTVAALHKAHRNYYKQFAQTSHDIGTRYIQLGNLVGGGSMALDIGEEDYTPILEKIGKEVVERVGETKTERFRHFELDRVPGKLEYMSVTIISTDGKRQDLSPNQWTIEGKILTLTDESLIQSLGPNDKIVINYQPHTNI